MSTVAVTDESFEARRAESRQARPGGLLGGVVRPVQADRPGAGADRPGTGGHVTVAKLNIEESPTRPSRYGVRGIPTMMLFKDGQMASMKVGRHAQAEDPRLARRNRREGGGLAQVGQVSGLSARTSPTKCSEPQMRTCGAAAPAAPAPGPGPPRRLRGLRLEALGPGGGREFLGRSGVRRLEAGGEDARRSSAKQREEAGARPCGPACRRSARTARRRARPAWRRRPRPARAGMGIVARRRATGRRRVRRRIFGQRAWRQALEAGRARRRAATPARDGLLVDARIAQASMAAAARPALAN